MNLEPNLRNRIRALLVIGHLMADELNRVGLVERRRFTSITHLLYLAYWWVTVIAVALLPTWSGEAVIYFGGSSPWQLRDWSLHLSSAPVC